YFVFRPPERPRQGVAVPAGAGGRARRGAQQAAASAALVRLVQRRFSAARVHEHGEVDGAVDPVLSRRRPRRESAVLGVVGGGYFLLAVGQYPGELRTDGDRGHGGGPAGRGLELERLSRGGRARRQRIADRQLYAGASVERGGLPLRRRQRHLRPIYRRAQPVDVRRRAAGG